MFTTHLKFRAFDFTTLQMIYKVLVGNTDEKDENYTCSLVWNEAAKEWLHFDKYCGEIMQYVGIRDKNGKDIYMGDIVSVNGRLCVMENKSGEIRGRWFYWVCDLDSISKGEVVGNIWQNKDLLDSQIIKND